MSELKKKFLYIALVCFNCAAYMAYFTTTPYFIGIFALLSIWLWIPISKQKRCKDCELMEPKRNGCLWCIFSDDYRKGNVRAGSMYKSYYTRKWYKFWRSK